MCSFFLFTLYWRFPTTKVYLNEFVANVLRNNMGIFWPPRLWRLLEAKNVICWRILWHFNSTFSLSHSVQSVMLIKDEKEMRSVMTLSLHFSISWFLVYYRYVQIKLGFRVRNLFWTWHTSPYHLGLLYDKFLKCDVVKRVRVKINFLSR